MDLKYILIKSLEIFAPILILAMSWLSVKVANFIKAKIKNEYFEGALIRLSDAIFTAVKELQQTVVAEIKLASEDGKLTDEEKKAIKSAAMNNLKAYLGPKGLQELANIFGIEQVDKVLSAKLEAAVHDIKEDSNE